MKNDLTCPNCGTENPIYSVSCIKCNSFIRDKKANIDFWHSVWGMILNPVAAAKNIIFSEHKNFTIAFLCLIILKLFLLKISLVYFIDSESNFGANIVNNFLIFSSTVISAFIVLSILATISSKLFNIKTRIKDNIALLIFSFAPILFSLMILTPVEYALLGSYWFFSNPTPFIVKPFAAWTLVVLEAFLIFWSFIIYIAALYTQSKNWIFAVNLSVVSFLILFFLMYLV